MLDINIYPYFNLVHCQICSGHRPLNGIRVNGVAIISGLCCRCMLKYVLDKIKLERKHTCSFCSEDKVQKVVKINGFFFCRSCVSPVLEGIADYLEKYVV